MIEKNEKAVSYLDRALQISADKPFVLYYAGYVYEQLGQRDKALEFIGRALALGYPLQEIERDPWLTDLRADERFNQLLLERERQGEVVQNPGHSREFVYLRTHKGGPR